MSQHSQQLTSGIPQPQPQPPVQPQTPYVHIMPTANEARVATRPSLSEVRQQAADARRTNRTDTTTQPCVTLADIGKKLDINQEIMIQKFDEVSAELRAWRRSQEEAVDILKTRLSAIEARQEAFATNGITFFPAQQCTAVSGERVQSRQSHGLVHAQYNQQQQQESQPQTAPQQQQQEPSAGVPTSSGTPAIPHYTLSDRVNTVADVWREWTVGLGGKLLKWRED